MLEQKCDNCRFRRTLKLTHPAPVGVFSLHQKEDTYNAERCCRYPEQVHLPRIKWCGEFQPTIEKTAGKENA